jgi:hypothetical protein
MSGWHGSKLSSAFGPRGLRGTQQAFIASLGCFGTHQSVVHSHTLPIRSRRAAHVVELADLFTGGDARRIVVGPPHQQCHGGTYRAGILVSPECLHAARCLREVPAGRVPRDLPINTEAARPDVPLAAQRRVGYLSLTLLSGSWYCRRAPSRVALGRTDNVLRKAISARRSASEPVEAEPVPLHQIRPRVKRFPATGAAKHERWNLRDLVLVSS